MITLNITNETASSAVVNVRYKSDRTDSINFVKTLLKYLIQCEITSVSIFRIISYELLTFFTKVQQKSFVSICLTSISHFFVIKKIFVTLTKQKI